MFCPNCGKQIPDESTFCPACGKKTDTRPAGASSTAERTSQRREKKFLPILIPGIILLVVAGVLALSGYASIAHRAKTARAKQDLKMIAVALETYRTDWGSYPVAVSGEEFGKTADNPVVSATISRELTGIDAATNRSGDRTLAGDDGGVEYVRKETIQAMQNPLVRGQGYHYATDGSGTSWVLWAEAGGKNSLYRTDKYSDLVLCATSDVPLPNQSSSGTNLAVSTSSNSLIGKWQAFSMSNPDYSLRDVSALNLILEFSNGGTFVSSSVDGSESGSYKVIDGSHVEMTVTAGEVVGFSIAGDELTLGMDSSDPEQVMKLRRTDKSVDTSVNSEVSEKSGKSLVTSDFSTLAVYLETFNSDWGQYPIESTYTSIEQSSGVYKELTGTNGAVLNSSKHSTLAGEKGPCEYVKSSTLDTVRNPWDGSSYLYRSRGGEDWTLAVKMPDGNYLVRVSHDSAIQEVVTLP
jgi:type II secretory pathway pseudopilin PulG